MPRIRKTERSETKVSIDETTNEEELQQDSIQSTQSEEPSEETPTKKRAVPTKETIMKELDDIIENIEAEVQTIRNSGTKTKGIRFLRSTKKRLTTLRSHAARVMKVKRVQKKQNANSGFAKPVKISEELAEFTGWDPQEKKSRNDVNRYICDYIKANNLQNPENKRIIMAEKDPKLNKLLKWSESEDPEPLNYGRLQIYMKPHYIKEE